MIVRTTSQKMAQEAFRRIIARKPGTKYKSFAREFPALVHSCGLAQALAFALASTEQHKKDHAYDLAQVLIAAGRREFDSAQALCGQIRDRLSVTAYIRLSRDALSAAGWLKRYAEAKEA